MRKSITIKLEPELLKRLQEMTKKSGIPTTRIIERGTEKELKELGQKFKE